MTCNITYFIVFLFFSHIMPLTINYSNIPTIFLRLSVSLAFYCPVLPSNFALLHFVKTFFNKFQISSFTLHFFLTCFALCMFFHTQLSELALTYAHTYIHTNRQAHAWWCILLTRYQFKINFFRCWNLLICLYAWLYIIYMYLMHSNAWNYCRCLSGLFAVAVIVVLPRWQFIE